MFGLLSKAKIYLTLPATAKITWPQYGLRKFCTTLIKKKLMSQYVKQCTAHISEKHCQLDFIVFLSFTFNFFNGAVLISSMNAVHILSHS